MIEGIQSYGTASASGKTTTGSNQLSMNDFLSLMVAQLSNQDMYNTVDDAQFMAQMAQFSMTQAMTDLSKITNAAYQISTAAYSVNLIGKEATIYVANSDGSTLLEKGIIEGVNMLNESAEVIMNGKTYPLSSVVSVREPGTVLPELIQENESVPEDASQAAEGADEGV